MNHFFIEEGDRISIPKCSWHLILRNVNIPTLRLEILTFLVELLPEGYPNIYVGEEFISTETSLELIVATYPGFDKNDVII